MTQPDLRTNPLSASASAPPNTPSTSNFGNSNHASNPPTPSPLTHNSLIRSCLTGQPPTTAGVTQVLNTVAALMLSNHSKFCSYVGTPRHSPAPAKTQYPPSSTPFSNSNSCKPSHFTPKTPAGYPHVRILFKLPKSTGFVSSNSASNLPPPGLTNTNLSTSPPAPPNTALTLSSPPRSTSTSLLIPSKHFTNGFPPHTGILPLSLTTTLLPPPALSICFFKHHTTLSTRGCSATTSKFTCTRTQSDPRLTPAVRQCPHTCVSTHAGLARKSAEGAREDTQSVKISRRTSYGSVDAGEVLVRGIIVSGNSLLVDVECRESPAAGTPPIDRGLSACRRRATLCSLGDTSPVLYLGQWHCRIKALAISYFKNSKRNKSILILTNPPLNTPPHSPPPCPSAINFPASEETNMKPINFNFRTSSR
ncbi:hypothetical protein DFS33DRAFT_220001 [Desarmillaria ectypa]|nr:hypothetical protein DFS33DRAFT_220001 [Desarmillaria ectypa]